MEALHWYTDVIKKYTLFEGRAGRQEFWMFVLFSIPIVVVLAIIDSLLGLRVGGGIGLLGSLYWLATLLPGLALGVRRLHDTNRAGIMILLGLIPCVGGIILIVFYAQPGVAGANQFGPDPNG